MKSRSIQRSLPTSLPPSLGVTQRLPFRTQPQQVHPLLSNVAPQRSSISLCLAARVRQLEKRLSQALGEVAWAGSGLGAPADIDQLQRRITILEQNLADIQGQLDERTDELKAARAANRELTRALNQASSRTPC